MSPQLCPLSLCSDHPLYTPIHIHTTLAYTRQMTLLSKVFPKRILVDEHGKATNIKLFSFGRPHMRAMHLSWLSFFVAFTSWFAIPPLMPTIKKDLQLTPSQISNANMTSVSATILARLIVVCIDVNKLCWIRVWHPFIIFLPILICSANHLLFSLPTHLCHLGTNM